MTLINVKCIDQKLYLANMPTIASGGINETKIKFDFCPLWDGLGKVAIFYCNEEAVYNVVIDNNECVVPYEVLVSSGKFYFGVFGTNEEGVRRTSDILAYKVVKGAFIEGQEPEEPTPDIYEQLIALYEKSLQNTETFYNNVLIANEETQAQIKTYRDELNYYAPFIKVDSPTPSAYNLEFDKTYLIRINWDDEVTNYNLTFNLSYDTNAVDDNKYATRSITVPLEKDQLGKQIKFRVFSWFNTYGQMLYFHYEKTLDGRKGIEYKDDEHGIAGNVKIHGLRLVRLDGTAIDLYIENEYGDSGAKGIVRANEALTGTEENLTSLTVNDTKYKFPSSIEHVTVSSFNISDMMHEMLSKYAKESKDSAYFVGNEYNKGQYYVYLDYAHSRVNFLVHVFNITGNTVYKSKVVDITNLPETIEYTIEEGNVEANPILDGTEQTLTGLSINSSKYKIPDNYYTKDEMMKIANVKVSNSTVVNVLKKLYSEGYINTTGDQTILANDKYIYYLHNTNNTYFSVTVLQIPNCVRYSIAVDGVEDAPFDITKINDISLTAVIYGYLSRANVALSGSEKDLTSLKVAGTIYKIPDASNKVNFKYISEDINLMTLYNDLIDEFGNAECILKVRGRYIRDGFLKIELFGGTVGCITYFDFLELRQIRNTNDLTIQTLFGVIGSDYGSTLSSVEANEELEGTEYSLTALTINGNRYKVVDENYVNNAVMVGRSTPNYESQEFIIIDNGLEFKSGYCCRKQIGEILWILISVVYKFTDSYEPTNLRKVLEFILPKEISTKLINTNGSATDTGTICYFPALTYENITYTTFNCQSYLSRTKIGDKYDTFTITFTGLSGLSKDGGLTGFHLRMPLLLI